VQIKVKKWQSASLYRHCGSVQAARPKGGSRGIAVLFLDRGTRRGEGSASRPGRSLLQGKIRYPLYRRLGGPQARSGQVRKIWPPTGIRSPDRSSRSQSLYRLSYSARTLKTYQESKNIFYSPLERMVRFLPLAAPVYRC